VIPTFLQRHLSESLKKNNSIEKIYLSEGNTQIEKEIVTLIENKIKIRLKKNLIKKNLFKIKNKIKKN
jgi:hypothetical protein